MAGSEFKDCNVRASEFEELIMKPWVAPANPHHRSSFSTCARHICLGNFKINASLVLGITAQDSDHDKIPESVSQGPTGARADKLGKKPVRKLGESS